MCTGARNWHKPTRPRHTKLSPDLPVRNKRKKADPAEPVNRCTTELVVIGILDVELNSQVQDVFNKRIQSLTAIYPPVKLQNKGESDSRKVVLDPVRNQMGTNPGLKET